jgi:hypothetical protein
MFKRYFLRLMLLLLVVACSDPNTIGLEVQPSSENIIFSNASSVSWQDSYSVSEDSLRTDEAYNLLLGEINDFDFGLNKASFYTQILLKENNTELGSNPIVDSVILSYNFSDYYGELESFTDLEVNQIFVNINKDSIYYSNSYEMDSDNMYNVDAFIISEDLDDPFIKIKLKNKFGQDILDLGSDALIDNENFLQNFNGISLMASSTNTMLYLNPDGTNSYLKIYYHNEESESDTLTLDFNLGGDAARLNLFNEKNESSIISDDSRLYIQSMAGYKVKISLNNLDSIKSYLFGKVLNKVCIIFDVKEGSQTEYAAHEKLVLVRVNEDGNNIFLSDLIIEGDTYFGGGLQDNSYAFNISRYFFQLLNNDSYTNDLYLLPAGAAANSNRTILDKDIKLQIYYSEL